MDPFAGTGGVGKRRGGAEQAMWDLLFVAVTLAFFLASVAYVSACNRLQ
jgi:hypothetical protein